MSNAKPTAKSIFLSAIEIASESERADFVNEQCVGDQAKLEEVQRLLANQAASSFLEKPAAQIDGTMDYRPIQEKAGSIVGPYRLMEQVGEGGFGLVFVAEQHKPIRRKVALKIIKPGMDTKEVIARFEAERQALALMDHPNIAKVLDAGVTDSGRPFFAMELIRGIPISEYCDNHELSTEQRLKLFVDVCRAVQHAHAKGVIHRDLKPSNILVSPHDGLPVVKIIDFGISKAIGQQLTDKTIYTRLNQMVGTPLYMSPEQAEINALDVDIRSDVYSLGVLLYELLTGTTPFDRDRFSKAAYEEIKRIIREEEPPSPSRRLSSLGATLTTVSKRRGTEPGRLTATVSGELDWIVMCCLEKDRSRRYQTAAELAADVHRFLEDEPVLVVPPSSLYRTQKYLRKNRLAITVVTGYVVLSLAGLGLFYSEKTKAKYSEEKAKQSAKIAMQSEAEANAKASQLQNAADLIAEQATGRILNLALTGEKDAALQALAKARGFNFGLDEDLLDSIEAMVYRYAENPETADEILKKVRKRDPEHFAGCSASYITLNHLGHYGEKAEALAPIVDWDPRSNVEKLFFCQVWWLAKPELVINMLDKVLAEEPLWGAAYQLRGRAQMEVAADQYRSKDAIQMFESGVSDLKRANSLSATEFTRAGYLFELVKAWEFAESQSLSSHLKLWQAEAQRIYDELGPTEDCQGDSFVARTSYLAHLEAEDALRGEWERMVATRTDDWVGGAVLFAKGDIDGLEKLIDNHDFKDTAWPEVMRAYLLADTKPDRNREASISEVLNTAFGSREFATDDEYLSADVYLLLGSSTLARQHVARTMAKGSLAEGSFFSVEAMQYLLEPSDEAATSLMEIAGPFGDRKAVAHYLQGMVALSIGEREKAKSQFESAWMCGRMDWWCSVWAFAFKTRLENAADFPNWPSWIGERTEK